MGVVDHDYPEFLGQNLMGKFLIGLIAGFGIAYLAYRNQTLNRSGFLSASILGTIVFGLGGVGWALVLLTFFISSSGLSIFFKAKKTIGGQYFAKGSQRDAGQVVANGGLAGVLALAYFTLSRFIPESNCLGVLWLGFAASLAGANADTWATELGLFNPRPPVLITSFKQVAKGTSGAVSLVGSLAAFCGSGLVAGLAVLVERAGWVPGSGLSSGRQLLLITLAGFIGALIDSYLGATLQSIYYCPRCDKETERHPFHVCGMKTKHLRGLLWMNNDWVNAACTLSAGLVGMILGGVL